MMLANLDLPAMEAPADLAASVLEKTSGPPCDRAHLLLCDHVDGRLPEIDEELVRLHLAGCGDCDALAAALARLKEDLPALAEFEPDANFVGDVLAATTYSLPPLPGFWDRLADAWKRAVLRPRFALEAAYVGTAALLLLFAAPFSPFRELPSQALAAVRETPRIVVAEGVEPVREIGEQVIQKTGNGVRGIAAGLDEKTRGIRRTGAEFGEKVLEGDFKGAWNRLRSGDGQEPPAIDSEDESPPEGGDRRRTP
jgi:hypothetical protein